MEREQPAFIEEKKRPELFQHVVDPMVALNEAQAFLQGGNLKIAEETITPIVAAETHNLQSEMAKGKDPPAFEYHISLWKFLAELMKKKGDKSGHDRAKDLLKLYERELKATEGMIKEVVKAMGPKAKIPKVWLLAAETMDKNGQIAGALHCRKEAYRLDQNDSEISKGFLVALTNARFYGMAREVAQNAINNGAQDSSFRQMLAISLVFQKKYEESLPVLREIAGIEPDNGIIWQLLSLSYGNLGRNREAAEALRKMIDLNHDGVRARRILREIESIKIDSDIVPGLRLEIPTAASVERSDDDSVVTQNDYVMLNLLMERGATSESSGMGPFADEPDSWMGAVIQNLVAKGLIVLTPERMAYLTEKGLKRIQEMQT